MNAVVSWVQEQFAVNPAAVVSALGSMVLGTWLAGNLLIRTLSLVLLTSFRLVSWLVRPEPPGEFAAALLAALQPPYRVYEHGTDKVKVQAGVVEVFARGCDNTGRYILVNGQDAQAFLSETDRRRLIAKAQELEVIFRREQHRQELDCLLAVVRSKQPPPVA